MIFTKIFKVFLYIYNICLKRQIFVNNIFSKILFIFYLLYICPNSWRYINSIISGFLRIYLRLNTPRLAYSALKAMAILGPKASAGDSRKKLENRHVNADRVPWATKTYIFRGFLRFLGGKTPKPLIFMGFGDGI